MCVRIPMLWCLRCSATNRLIWHFRLWYQNERLIKIYNSDFDVSLSDGGWRSALLSHFQFSTVNCAFVSVCALVYLQLSVCIGVYAASYHFKQPFWQTSSDRLGVSWVQHQHNSIEHPLSHKTHTPRMFGTTWIEIIWIRTFSFIFEIEQQCVGYSIWLLLVLILNLFSILIWKSEKQRKWITKSETSWIRWSVQFWLRRSRRVWHCVTLSTDIPKLKENRCHCLDILIVWHFWNRWPTQFQWYVTHSAHGYFAFD